MRQIRVRGLALVVTCALALTLTGCSANDGFPIFDREAGAADVLPDDFDSFEPSQFDDFDLDTVRFAANHGDVALYLLKDHAGLVCLAVAAGTRSGISCGGPGLLGTSIPGAGEFETAPAPIGEKDGWTVLSENIRVHE